MSVYELLLFVIVALICGSIARGLGGGTRGGCLVSLAVTFIGALLGGKLSQVLNLPEPFVLRFGGHSLPVIWSIIGGALFVAALRLLGGRSSR
jgi:uncharacterized membrane protein YeaQ/YmgE (transglycosylase-associated protein family)